MQAVSAAPGNPACIDSLINVFKKEAVTNPPRKIVQYDYKGQTVYYVPAICCDFFSDVYDNNCNVIGHPDGGFTGSGDGKMKDFKEVAKNPVVIWEDARKQ